MDILSDFHKNNVLAKIIITLLCASWILFFTVYIFNLYNKQPYEYENSVWKCSEPSIEMSFNGVEEHCVYYSTEGEIELSVSFVAGNGIVIEEKGNEAEFFDDAPFKGYYICDSEFYRVSVTKNELFDGNLEELEFVRVK